MTSSAMEFLRKVTLVLSVLGGLSAFVLWYWLHWQMAETREEHQKTWPCASYASYPMRDVPLRCLPGTPDVAKDGG
jgi:hypothetical protein